MAVRTVGLYIMTAWCKGDRINNIDSNSYFTQEVLWYNRNSAESSMQTLKFNVNCKQRKRLIATDYLLTQETNLTVHFCFEKFLWNNSSFWKLSQPQLKTLFEKKKLLNFVCTKERSSLNPTCRPFGHICSRLLL